jgi:AcrR family transcriptional regulator
MSKTENAAKDTRLRVLESACRAFAAKGYRDTTIQEICDGAGANVASVNYYFGNKEKLYWAVWGHAMSITRAAHPVDWDAGRSPDERIRDLIRARILAIFDRRPGGWMPRIVQREMADPTDMTPSLLKTFMKPMRLKLEAVVRETLGAKADDFQVRSCAFSVMSQFVFLNVGRRARLRLFGRETPTKRQLDRLIRQAQEFALAGIRGVQEAIGKGRLG